MYRHPRGAVVWANLVPALADVVEAQLTGSWRICTKTTSRPKSVAQIVAQHVTYGRHWVHLIDEPPPYRRSLLLFLLRPERISPAPLPVLDRYLKGREDAGIRRAPEFIPDTGWQG